jgi:hypothetical protein
MNAQAQRMPRRIGEHPQRLAAARQAPPLLSLPYGFPAGQAARIAVTMLRSTPTKVELIRLVAFDPETRALLTAAVS